MKPGYKSSEFWLTLVFVIASSAGTSGLFVEESTEFKILAAIAAGLAAAGYSVSRGIAKKAGLVLLTFLACSSKAIADEYLLIRKGTQSKLLRVDDSLRVHELQVRVVDLDDGPQPPPTPVPDELSSRARQIKKVADAVVGDPKREETAGNLAALTREIAKIMGDKITGHSQLTVALTAGYSRVLGGAANQWAPFRETMSRQMTTLVQDGASDAQYAAYLDEVADGLEASAGDFAQIDIATILAIIKMILELIENLKESGQLSLDFPMVVPTEVATYRSFGRRQPYLSLD